MIGSLYNKKTDDTVQSANRVTSRVFHWLAVLAALWFLASTIYGAWLNYSPVPLSDSWEGIVDFYLRSLTDPWAWWHQHYDHRIFFSKIFFWLDMRYFGGRNLLLIPLNIALMLAICWTLYRYALRILGTANPDVRMPLLACLSMTSLAWMQWQNITWEFQSQFYLVYLFPLLCFYAHGRSVEHGGSAGWALASLVLGFCSAFSMANGIFALPILVLLTAITTRSWRRTALVVVVAALAIGLFFFGYEETPGRKFGPSLLVNHPFKVIAYALAYLGNPFYWVFGNIQVAVAAGLGAVLLSLYLLVSPLRRSPFALGLLAYVLFIFCTAGATAFGRSLFNIELAASSRYTTPALSMWSALLILVVARWQLRFKAQTAVRVLFLLVAALLTGQQQRALYFHDPDPISLAPHAKAVLALGLQMGIDDPQAPARLFPFASADEMRRYFGNARQAGVSIFSAASAFPANSVGQPIAGLQATPCPVEQLDARQVDAAHQASQVQGKLGSTGGKHYRYVFFVDSEQKVTGVALLGRTVLDTYSLTAGRKLFDGYVFGEPRVQTYCR